MSLEENKGEGACAQEAVTRLVEASLETLTDEMIGRLAKTASESLTLLDEIHRSRLHAALPILSQLVVSGDLERLAQVARLLGAAEDALTDDIIMRLASFASRGLTVLDNVHQLDAQHDGRLWARVAPLLAPDSIDRVVKALPVILALLEQVQESGLLTDVMVALERARKDLDQQDRPAGGIGGLWTLLKDPTNQRTIQGLLLFGRHMLGKSKAS